MKEMWLCDLGQTNAFEAALRSANTTALLFGRSETRSSLSALLSPDPGTRQGHHPPVPRVCGPPFAHCLPHLEHQ